MHGIDVLDRCPGSLEALLHGIDVLDRAIRIGPIKKGSGVLADYFRKPFD